eukprot:TRINITY_DN2571_c0_g2_i1.p1 TRINITY_DN2571_c0_g2~~TRINITY_DN2571_c0_g2_i1.p1  ORF type:complete len:398 (+),score=101.10 TRINITY_DN2571_c0_g2_i1:185-1378(+)
MGIKSYTMENNKLLKDLEKLQKQISINEDNDVFLDYINKKIRNLNKKIEQIEVLEQKSSDQLKPEQVEKMTSKPLINQEIMLNLQMKLQYYMAHQKLSTLPTVEFMKSSSSIVSKQLNKSKQELIDDIQNLIIAAKLLGDQQMLQKFNGDITYEEAEQVIKFYNNFIAMRIQDKDVNEISAQIEQQEKSKKDQEMNEKNEKLLNNEAQSQSQQPQQQQQETKQEKQQPAQQVEEKKVDASEEKKQSEVISEKQYSLAQFQAFCLSEIDNYIKQNEPIYKKIRKVVQKVLGSNVYNKAILSDIAIQSVKKTKEQQSVHQIQEVCEEDEKDKIDESQTKIQKNPTEEAIQNQQTQKPSSYEGDGETEHSQNQARDNQDPQGKKWPQGKRNYEKKKLLKL